jgi:sporulation protein YlmC with PRC-barrel domain
MNYRQFAILAVAVGFAAGCEGYPKLTRSDSQENTGAAPVASNGASSATQQPAPPPPCEPQQQAHQPTTTPDVAAQGGDAAGRKSPLIFSSSLVGSRVKDSKGNDVGKIKDLLFDPENRRVVYAIVALSNREIAVPLGAIKMDPQTQTYTLEMTEDTYSAAPNQKDAQSSTETRRDDDLAASSSGTQSGNVTR